MEGLLNDIGHAYEREIVDRGKQPELIFLVSFLITFGIVRFITHSIRSQRFSWLKDVESGDLHIHHLVWGILLLIVTGYLAIALDFFPNREVLAVLFGIGVGLTLDEFALWLNLEDVYWSTKGRRSVDAVVITAVFAGIVLLGIHFWIEVILSVEIVYDAALAGIGIVGFALSILCFLKGKVITGVVGLFIPYVSLVGAIRLARPNSRWARRYGPKKLDRAQRRYHYERQTEPDVKRPAEAKA